MTITLMPCLFPAFLTTSAHLSRAYGKKNREQFPTRGDRISDDVLIRQL
ncbi:hypothetical protein [Leclercia adecarboxylata]|nr:hypothetical protein NRF19_22120 [Leclercia adecarboxylata]